MTEHSRGSGRQRSSRQRHDDREFRSADGLFGLVIGEAQVMKMRESCARAHPLETGGILIGCYNEGHDTALVSRVTESPADSKSGPRTFRRGTRGLQGLLEALWSRREYYLGEWHYHPGASARPSSTDTRQMLAIAEDEDVGCPEPVLVILGRADAVSAEVFPRGRRAVQLTPVSICPAQGDAE